MSISIIISSTASIGSIGFSAGIIFSTAASISMCVETDNAAPCNIPISISIHINIRILISMQICISSTIFTGTSINTNTNVHERATDNIQLSMAVK